jgi:hypothetical protein
VIRFNLRRFKELSDLRPGKTTEKEAIAWLKRAQQAVSHGYVADVLLLSHQMCASPLPPRLECSVLSDRQQVNAITAQASRLIALDIR